MSDTQHIYNLVEVLGPIIQEAKIKQPPFDQKENVFESLGYQAEFMVALYEKLIDRLRQDNLPVLEKLIGDFEATIDEYQSILDAVEIATLSMEEGKMREALHYASIAGMLYETNPRGGVDNILKNLDSGRDKGVKSRQETAQERRRIAEQIIEGLFAFNDFRKTQGRGWRMSNKQIYEFIRSTTKDTDKPITWGDKHAERTIGPYIGEVKARHYPK